jgi:hypothetical protein
MTHCIGSCKNVKTVSFAKDVLSTSNYNRNTSKSTIRTRKHKLPKRQIVPNSGATAHMLNELDDFGKDYKQCCDVFVYMGDGTPVPVHGYGTARIKMDRKV